MFPLAGCKSAPARDPAFDLASERQAIYTQPPVQFDRAALCKPKANVSDAPPTDLAPIFILQDDDGAVRFVTCPSLWRILSAAGEAQSQSLQVYAAESTAIIGGVEHEQRVFVWWGALKSHTGSPFEPVQWRGLRMTLDHQGSPVVWELIDSSSAIVGIYVARSLDERAARQFGGPLPGRRFAIERAVSERPDVVVAGVLDDGPVPMGPMIYVRAKDGAVATVICRCMPSQVRAIDDTENYELRPLDNTCGWPLEDLLAAAAADVAASDKPSAAWVELAELDWLERALRIDAGL